jgi:nucleotide-binding universal stress UspA family protein
MSKILIALDQKTSLVRDLASICKDLISDCGGHFFEALVVKDLSYSSTLTPYFKEPAMANQMPGDYGLLTDEDQKKTEVISNFEKEARAAGIRYHIHNDFKVTATELVKHTTYSDLLILSYQIFFDHIDNRPDTSLLYHVLKGSRCPVLIVPEGARSVKNIIFTYDGKESSVFAIRAFSSLFGLTARDMEVTILTITPNAEEEIENEAFLLGLIKQHFNNVGLQLLPGTNISGEILNFAQNAEDPLVVMGAYGRSTISNLIIPSVARRIIEHSKIPLFIAHR